MQEILVDMAVLGLFVCLFVAVSNRRRDDRLRCWIAGWLLVMAHFGFELVEPKNALLNRTLDFVDLGSLAAAAVCFVVSTMVLQEGRASGFQVGFALGLPTIVCVGIATLYPQAVWPLTIAFTVRQIIAVLLANRLGRRDRRAGLVIGGVCAVTTVLALVAVLNKLPEAFPPILLGEMFLVAGIDFWSNTRSRSNALGTMVAGFVSWGLVLPLSFVMLRFYPQIEIDREVWNIPEFFAAIGMILLVLEEDSHTERALRDDYQLLFDRNPQALWIVEADTQRTIAANQAALAMHGYTHEEFLALHLQDIVHPESYAMASEHAQSQGEVQHALSRHVHKDGHEFVVDICAPAIVFNGKQCRFVMAVDVTEKEHLKQKLNQQSTHDLLTWLPNRQNLHELLPKAVEAAKEVGDRLAMLLIDMDRFKRVNDLYGFRVGDECIRHLATQLAANIRSMDIVARVGGDEFAVVLTGIKGTANVEQIAHSLLAVLSEPMIIDGYKIQLSGSMGLAVFPDDGADPTALWRSAESARSQAKMAGGGKLVWISPELNRLANEQIEIETYLRTNLNDGGFSLAYQPIYGIDGRVRELEALLRLNHPQLGPVSPARLIPIAEESGLVVPLGQWVIESACRQILLWRSQGVPIVPVAVNVSGLQLMHVDFAKNVLQLLERYKIDPSLIQIEVTESVAMQNAESVSEQIAALSSKGMTFSIDDFGTGYSSLARLSELGVSVLKIDRSFMNPVCTPHAHTIVEAIITMAHALGRVVVAEGVETQEQLNCLRDLRCDMIQGYLLSKPIAPEAIPALVTTTHPLLETFPASPSSDTLHLVTPFGT